MIIKCKMCGGDIQFNPGDTYGTCEFCGSTSTIPKSDDEGKLNRYNRANHFRRQCEFDKAVDAYEKILEQDDTDAEAHWGAVISRFGIEYVVDPATGKRIPTCHRVQLTSILADEDYKAAVQYAPDTESRRLYEEEAGRIAEIQKGILAISQNEKPYDVFICYKETDDSGQRTHDSQWAQDVYYGLTEQGYKVFFSRITLEDKLGQEYEPYIFAALNSAKVMVVIGSKPEYFNAVWVKNEWSRYLSLMVKDRKRLLIPCYRDMDPYDLPDELSSLQSQDMSKIGFIQDLIRGIQKVVNKNDNTVANSKQESRVENNTNIENLMKRARLFMEDGDWTSAEEYLDKVLDENAEYAPAYIGKIQVELKLQKEEELKTVLNTYEQNPNWIKALRFASEEQQKTYNQYLSAAQAYREEKRKAEIYDSAIQKYRAAKSSNDFSEIGYIFNSISGFRDSDEKARTCFEKRKEYEEKEALRKKERQEIEARAQKEAEERKKKLKKKIVIIAITTILLITIFMIITRVIIPERNRVSNYDKAIALYQEGNEPDALVAFRKALGYKDALDYVRLLEKKYTNKIACSGIFGSTQFHAVANSGHVLSESNSEVRSWNNIVDILGTQNSVIALTSEGKVYFSGYYQSSEERGNVVEQWSDIIQIAASDDHTVGLKKDGTVVATGDNLYGQCDVSDWRDVVYISAGENNTVGIKNDGSLLISGAKGTVKKEDPSYKFYGNSTVVSFLYPASFETTSWSNLEKVFVGEYYIIGIQKNGNVLASGGTIKHRLNSSLFNSISYSKIINSVHYGFLGLRTDGDIDYLNYSGEKGYSLETKHQDNILDIVSENYGWIALNSDGTISGSSKNFKEDHKAASSWNLFAD